MSKYQIGDKFKLEVIFNQNDVEDFARITGDNNPLHLDVDYAAQTPFKRPIVHGFLSGAVFSKVIGTQFPGFGSIYVSQTMNFKRPVFVGEQYTANFEVTELLPEKNMGKISCQLISAQEKIVLEGEALVKNIDKF